MAPDGSVLVVETKQISTAGSASLSKTNSEFQLSETWLKAAAARASDNQILPMIKDAILNNKLSAAIAGIDRATGNVVMQAVKVK